MKRNRSLGLVSRNRKKPEQGVALITVLLLLLLLTGMTVAMVISLNSDMLINGYYRNFRGAFYAADSGLNVARQQLFNQVQAAVPATFSAGTQPIPPGTTANIQSYIQSTYGASYIPVSGNGSSGSAAGSWPGKFKIDPTSVSFSLASCQVLGGGGTCAAPTGTPTGYRYIYNYSLTSLGQSQGNEAMTLTDSGSLTVTATVGQVPGVKTSFSAWGMFIDHYDICSGSYLVPGTISGPVFTNGAWTFGQGGNYTFTDSVGSASSQFGYQYSVGGSPCQQSNATSDSYTANGVSNTIAPTFAVTPQLGQNPIALPSNDFQQQRAVLDGVGDPNQTQPPPSNSDRAAVLRDVNKTQYSASGQSSGVWLPYTVNPTTGAASFTGGGILVEGDASVTLSTSGSSAQVYTITQGGSTTTITIDPAANVTLVSSGSTSLTISGVPKQYNGSGGVLATATMLYVDGNITGLSGPGQGTPAIQDGAQLTITASNNITITGDILYKTPPVTLSNNQIPNTPADTLIPGNDKGQVLGIFTKTGDIQMANSQPNGNLEIDACLATISQGGSGGLTNIGGGINTLTIVGGRIQNQIKNINTSTRNVLFDRRFSSGFGPPWFPSTTITGSGVFSSTLDHIFQRTQWLNLTSYN